MYNLAYPRMEADRNPLNARGTRVSRHQLVRFVKNTCSYFFFIAFPRVVAIQVGGLALVFLKLETQGCDDLLVCNLMNLNV